MLADQSYYDYDYEPVKKGAGKRREETAEQKRKRTKGMAGRFNFGKVETLEDAAALQAAARRAAGEEEKDKGR